MTTINWHHELNQIFVGTMESSIYALYDPKLSKDGIMKCIERQQKRRPADGQVIVGNSILQLPKSSLGKRKRESDDETEIFLHPDVYEAQRRKDKFYNKDQQTTIV